MLDGRAPFSRVLWGWRRPLAPVGSWVGGWYVQASVERTALVGALRHDLELGIPVVAGARDLVVERGQVGLEGGPPIQRVAGVPPEPVVVRAGTGAEVAGGEGRRPVLVDLLDRDVGLELTRPRVLHDHRRGDQPLIRASHRGDPDHGSALEHPGELHDQDLVVATVREGEDGVGGELRVGVREPLLAGVQLRGRVGVPRLAGFAAGLGRLATGVGGGVGLLAVAGLVTDLFRVARGGLVDLVQPNFPVTGPEGQKDEHLVLH